MVRKELVTIDVSTVTTPKEFHEILQKNLDFPKFYGMNWDAFWDAITGLVYMPLKLEFIGWNNIKAIMPDDSLIFQELINDLNTEYPTNSTEIIYR